MTRFLQRILGRSPFGGSIRPRRVPLLAPISGRPTQPFPHPWNYREPIRILETFFWDPDEEAAESDAGRHGDSSPGRDDGGLHNRYLDVPGFKPVLVTRDPGLIRAIATETGDREGQFDRDTLPSTGIARATGEDTLLYANGPAWKRQKRLSTPPFGRTTLFQPEQFGAFAETFRQTVHERLRSLSTVLLHRPAPHRVELEQEIKAVMLEMLVNNFFGAELTYAQVRDTHVPALDRVIDHIVRDTVINKLGIPLRRLPSWLPGISEAKQAQAAFEELTDIALSTRGEGLGLWKQFKSEAPDAMLRSNIKVFLAGALEATTSYASWAISHLARHPEAQERVFHEVKDMTDYTPEGLAKATYLGQVLDETLRLTPSLYFLPRRATVDTTIETLDGRTLSMPKGTHILLDVWHANRLESHWGVAVTGYPAMDFAPDRWEGLTQPDIKARNLLHFGFGHGPRFCPGKHLGQMEVALVVGALVKLFRFTAASKTIDVRAGVSTKPRDGTLVELTLRERAKQILSGEQ